MDWSRWLLRGPAVPVALLVVAGAVVYVSTTSDEADRAAAADLPNELWRCQACAKAPGKSWIPCKTVTGRGNEKGARDRVKEVVCEEAGVPVQSCTLTNIRCERLDAESEGGAAPAPSE